MPLLLQCNLNRSWGAYNLLTQIIKEKGIGACAVSEPQRAPDSDKWCKSNNGLAAICWEPKTLGRTAEVIGKGEDYVTADLGEFRLVSVYISPNATREEFLEFLDDLSEEVRRLDGRRVIVCGDFNSKSIAWGSPKTDRRGEMVEEWAAETDMRLVNTGLEPTCVRVQGESYIDLTWASPDLMSKIRNWQVLKQETLSDHAYICVEVGDPVQDKEHKASGRLSWNWRRVNSDLFQASIAWKCAVQPEEERAARKLTKVVMERP